ncbi:MAG: hypothetical protein MJ078_05765 [Clostridia bacterium]|nr:hypothetical protein [Clostridia bacterium]
MWNDTTREYGDEPFLLRSPAEIKDELDEMDYAVKEARNKLSRLKTVGEELDTFNLPQSVLAVVMPILKEKTENIMEELEGINDDMEALKEEWDDTLYLLGYSAS